MHRMLVSLPPSNEGYAAIRLVIRGSRSLAIALSYCTQERAYNDFLAGLHLDL